MVQIFEGCNALSIRAALDSQLDQSALLSGRAVETTRSLDRLVEDLFCRVIALPRPKTPLDRHWSLLDGQSVAASSGLMLQWKVI